jgi:hypothetical protein
MKALKLLESWRRPQNIQASRMTRREARMATSAWKATPIHCQYEVKDCRRRQENQQRSTCHRCRVADAYDMADSGAFEDDFQHRFLHRKFLQLRHHQES